MRQRQAAVNTVINLPVPQKTTCFISKANINLPNLCFVSQMKILWYTRFQKFNSNSLTLSGPVAAALTVSSSALFQRIIFMGFE